MNIKKLLGLPYSNKNIQLSDEVKLAFVKNDLGEYEVNFYNPFKNRWWVLPEIESGIHAPWSFKEKGSYGAYDLGVLETEYNYIDYYRKQFKTLADIQKYFDEVNKEFTSFRALKQRQDDMPDVIY